MKFSELNLDPGILEALDAMRFDECTPIQEKAIPPLLEGRDLVGVAQTGTGKTAAYLLPIINRLCTEDFPKDAINCIIMSPTRELAQQIDQAMEGFSYFLPVSSVAVYGGNDGIRYEQELRGMQLGADMIIATPGRLISHMQLGNIDLSRVSIFVLDEADRMLDMGFIDDIMKIIKALPAKRQTMLFSATMPREIRKLADEILTNPVHVEIAITKPAEGIRQSAYICTDSQKAGILKYLFKKEQLKRVLIFAGSKQKVRELTVALKHIGVNASEMHSDLEQKQRDQVMRDFKAGHIDVLVATDIISRGIDIDDIAVVINFDVPRDVEDYVHRIGRTARAGRGGRAITLVNGKDRPYFVKIERLLEKKIELNDLPEGLGKAPAFKLGEEERKGQGGRRPSRNRRGRSGQRSRRSGNDENRRALAGTEGGAQSVSGLQATAVPNEKSAEGAENQNARPSKRRHRGGRRHRKPAGTTAPAATAEQTPTESNAKGNS